VTHLGPRVSVALHLRDAGVVEARVVEGVLVQIVRPELDKQPEHGGSARPAVVPHHDWVVLGVILALYEHVVEAGVGGFQTGTGAVKEIEHRGRVKRPPCTAGYEAVTHNISPWPLGAIGSAQRRAHKANRVMAAAHGEQ
jgi:hypothetical protein